MNLHNMKRILFLCFALALGVSLSAQQYKYTFANDTVKGDTNYYPSPTGFIKSVTSTGVVSFTLTHTDVKDSLKYVRLEGSDDAITWVALTGNAALVNTTTDGTSKIYASTPLTYLYYRAFVAAASGDTVAVTSPILIYKDK
jgi:hypothetical protein